MCPCGCNREVKSGNKFATAGCAGRAARGAKRKLNLSSEDRQVRAERMKRLRKDPEFQAHLADAIQSRPTQYISDRNRRRWQDPKYREEQTDRIRAMQSRFTEDRRRMKTEYWQNQEHRAEQSIRAKRLWEQEDYRKKMFTTMKERFAVQLRLSQPHKLFKAALNAAGLTSFESNLPIGRFCVDEADSALKIAIEVDGCFWHGCQAHYTRACYPSQKRRMKSDLIEATYMKQCEWLLLRFWEHEINTNIDACISRVNEVVQSRRKEL